MSHSAPAPQRRLCESRAYDVRPGETDPAIQLFDQPHRIFLDAAATPRGELLLFLPGTGATTRDQEEFGRTAAGLGYHVVYLMYPNDVPAAVCQDDEDENVSRNSAARSSAAATSIRA